MAMSGEKNKKEKQTPSRLLLPVPVDNLAVAEHRPPVCENAAMKRPWPASVTDKSSPIRNSTTETGVCLHQWPPLTPFADSRKPCQCMPDQLFPKLGCSKMGEEGGDRVVNRVSSDHACVRMNDYGLSGGW